MSDLKDRYYERAEELAYERYDCGFYDLPQDKQTEIYEEAIHGVAENLFAQADYLRKAERERR